MPARPTAPERLVPMREVRPRRGWPRGRQAAASRLRQSGRKRSICSSEILLFSVTSSTAFSWKTITRVASSASGMAAQGHSRALQDRISDPVGSCPGHFVKIRFIQARGTIPATRAIDEGDF